MDTPLPPVPADLWPTIPPTRSQRALHKAFSVEISNASAKPLLGALAESVHYEMACAGQWAAKPASDPLGKLQPSIVRGRALDAAQLLSIYTAVYHVTDCPGEIELTPDALKASATRAYQVGFRKERDELEKMGVSFNDDLYNRVKGRSLGGKPGLSR
jgi:hypothetical protein